MNAIDQLTAILQRLNAGEDPARVRKEAQALLATLNPADLAMAEQRLIEAGLPPEELRRLCAIHMEMLGDELTGVKTQLPVGHMIHTLVNEHDAILKFLDSLEQVNAAVQQMERYDGSREEFVELAHIADHLVEAESHHRREEEVLFPELERRGITGPTRIMRMEHDILRPLKKELQQLAATVSQENFAVFRENLDRVSNVLVPTLRDHIFKENTILYPTALQTIGADSPLWEQMKQAADRIGYCCFTPVETGIYTLDLRPLPPWERHERIFAFWEGLKVGETLRIINDHDPRPLHYQFMVEYADQYVWEYEQQGPQDWVVRIRKTREAVPVAGD